MIEIDNKIISLDVFEKQFVCDLNACKGACCVEGDAGAPLEEHEITDLENAYEKAKPYMRQSGIEAVEKQGVYYKEGNEFLVSLVDGKECAFVYFDEKGHTKCAIEKAYLNGETDFKKPISCHLYPIRAKRYRAYEALNYSKWNICDKACSLGQSLGVRVYEFLKEPIIRKWGDSFYDKLHQQGVELNETQG